MTPNTEMADQTVQTACIFIYPDVDKASCMVWLPNSFTAKFDGVGRDGEGGYLQTEDGEIIRITADSDHLDAMLAKADVLLSHMDEDGLTVDEYSISKIDADNRIGFNA
jgi:hypothetical protein